MRVRIWLTSPVLLWSSQFLYQVSTSVLQEGLYQIHLIKQSYYEAFNSKLNMYRDLNAELYWQCYTITQLQSLYRTRVCISWSFDNKLLYQMSESALLVERWTIRYLAEPPPLSTHPTLSSLANSKKGIRCLSFLLTLNQQMSMNTFRKCDAFKSLLFRL